MPDQHRYGEWPSPVSAEAVASGGVDFGAVAVDGDAAYWLERRPDEDGRGVVCRAGADGGVEAVTPADANVRTLVHEYGGGDFAVREGTLVYSRLDDQRLYRVDATDPGSDAEAVALTPAPETERGLRYADAAFTPDGDAVYCVRERHEGEGSDEEAVNELVRVTLDPADGSDDPTVVASGHDFYAAPRVSPDGERLAWLTWDHPRMPWDGTDLRVADVEVNGSLTDGEQVLGGPTESAFAPSWGPDGDLYAVSDRTGWWNLYRVAMDPPGGPAAVCEEAAEYGAPQWAFGLSTYAHLDDGRVAAVRNAEGRHEMVLVDTDTGEAESAELPYEAYPHPRVVSDGGTVVAVAAGPGTPPTVVRWTPGSDPETVRRSVSLDVDDAYLPDPEHVAFPTGEEDEDDEEAHALFYPPTNPGATGPADEDPPLVVKVHGGPTSQSLPVADLEVAYFTSRGVGVADVNYRGSTGYGREYRDALRGEWGVADTLDCVRAAEFLADRGDADPDRLAVRGGSAGGYAALASLAFHDTFAAGTSYYGVADLRSLAEHTHKFESRYLDGLVGPLPDAAETYDERSPAGHADRISEPLLVLQGEEDRVVPSGQADRMVEALVDSGVPYAYAEFVGERHGFRRADSRRRALETEFGFYAAVFGFAPADGVAPLELDRGTYRKRTVGGEDDEGE